MDGWVQGSVEFKAGLSVLSERHVTETAARVRRRGTLDRTYNYSQATPTYLSYTTFSVSLSLASPHTHTRYVQRAPHDWRTLLHILGWPYLSQRQLYPPTSPPPHTHTLPPHPPPPLRPSTHPQPPARVYLSAHYFHCPCYARNSVVCFLQFPFLDSWCVAGSVLTELVLRVMYTCMYTVSTDPADCWPTRPGEAAALLINPTRPVNSGLLFERCAVVIAVSTELILLVTSGPQGTFKKKKKKEGKKCPFPPLLNMRLITLPMTTV